MLDKQYLGTYHYFIQLYCEFIKKFSGSKHIMIRNSNIIWWHHAKATDFLMSLLGEETEPTFIPILTLICQIIIKDSRDSLSRKKV